MTGREVTFIAPRLPRVGFLDMSPTDEELRKRWESRDRADLELRLIEAISSSYTRRREWTEAGDVEKATEEGGIIASLERALARLQASGIA